ncbi:hypothetical protein KM043_011613 [Ampulex compressa]|nr:hypothetical protein KM043_011613 [Ampulex compressa]
MQSNTILRDVANTEKLMGNNNNLNNNGSPGADIMFQMEDEGLTQLGSVFQSAYQSIVGGGPQVSAQVDSFPTLLFYPIFEPSRFSESTFDLAESRSIDL